ncbi:hypothetical protein [Actinomycetospora cinnamomea]|uniref:Uncharacterized protein n=1 Tax=Actinomycetospora cinnamomea TaxID=663609 RepID=A0A2U1FIJ1_9PSEU|nr:hypothetical protein [Actinomycetospora cinnamomea]PVZ12003.1 hypothetical protein C8D89_103334 [Actinomycetospora cinnamomea]
MTAVRPDPAILPSASPTEPGEILVAVPDGPGRDAAATLSCRLHGIIAGAGDAAPVTIVVAAGEHATDPHLARVLECARECATSRGLGFVVR